MFWMLSAFFYSQRPPVLATPILVTRAIDCAVRHNWRAAMHHHKEIR